MCVTGKQREEFLVDESVPRWPAVCRSLPRCPCRPTWRRESVESGGDWPENSIGSLSPHSLEVPMFGRCPMNSPN
jgi:hypothetical protein